MEVHEYNAGARENSLVQKQATKSILPLQKPAALEEEPSSEKTTTIVDDTYWTTKKRNINEEYLMWLGAKAVLEYVGRNEIRAKWEDEIEDYDVFPSGPLPKLLERVEHLDQDLFEEALDKTVFDESTRDNLREHYYHGHGHPPPYVHPDSVAANFHLTPLKKKMIILPPPSNGRAYDDDEMIGIIKKYPEGSRERGEIRNLMLKKGYVSSRTTFYRRVNKNKDQEAPPHTARPSDVKLKRDARYYSGLGYEGDFVKWNIRHNVKWKGSIVMSLIPICFEDEGDVLEIMDRGTFDIDICSVIGNSDMVTTVKQNQCKIRTMMLQDPAEYSSLSNFAQLCQEKKLLPLKYKQHKLSELGKRWSKLYFPPWEYPPPSNIHKPPDSIVFGHLRNYVKGAAKLGGSPVVSVGCSNQYEKRFKCQFWYRRNKRDDQSDNTASYRRPYNMYSCTFSFAIQWDNYGYYIPLIRNEKHIVNSGCAWHCCKEEPSKKSKTKLTMQK